MEHNEYFKKALSDFTFDAASGGAIRHLADCGYTPQQILKMLDFPTPYERIQDEVWKHFVDNRTLILEESGIGHTAGNYEFVTEYDAYGKRSFRKVRVGEKENRIFSWDERTYQEERDGPLRTFLALKCEENTEKDGKIRGRNSGIQAYISCDFGLQSYRDAKRFVRSLDRLEEAERDYILGLPWEKRTVYHRLDERMRRIAAGLYGEGSYHADVYLIQTREKIRIEEADL
ncbi:MAG: hypothetical protein LUD07_08990 [Clostridiales bacterium]|nr:hypothetical protein [Clostridiales bacterium]